jgi:hypothetical protein
MSARSRPDVHTGPSSADVKQQERIRTLQQQREAAQIPTSKTASAVVDEDVSQTKMNVTLEDVSKKNRMLVEQQKREMLQAEKEWQRLNIDTQPECSLLKPAESPATSDMTPTILPTTSPTPLPTTPQSPASQNVDTVNKLRKEMEQLYTDIQTGPCILDDCNIPRRSAPATPPTTPPITTVKDADTSLEARDESSIFRDSAISVSFQEETKDTSTSAASNRSAYIDDEDEQPYRRLGQRKGKELVGEPDDVGCTGDAQVSIPIPDTEADSTTELDEEEAIQMQITLHNILMESAGSSSIESKAEQSWSSWNSISRVWRASAETERSERRVGAGALAK